LADFFERVERVLTLENAKDELVVQNVGKLYNLTLQLLEECRGEGAKNDEDAARMDAYGEISDEWLASRSYSQLYT